jgi:hypothetical protein
MVGIALAPFDGGVGDMRIECMRRASQSMARLELTGRRCSHSEPAAPAGSAHQGCGAPMAVKKSGVE